MSKQKTNETWSETERREAGVYLSPEGEKNQTFTYACILYEVTETNGAGGWRTRLEHGESLFQHKTEPSLWNWFGVLRLALKELLPYARALDGRKPRR